MATDKPSLKRVPVAQKSFVVRPKLVEAFSPRLYPSRRRALDEIVANGRDACVRKGSPVVIDIVVLPEGNRFFSGHTVVVTDHGIGFPSDENWKNYLWIGESVHEGVDTMFGANGLGKFAPLFFADRFTVRTCSNDGDDVFMLEVAKDSIISLSNGSPSNNFFLGRRGDIPTDPTRGSFTSIVVQDMKVPYSEEEIFRDLAAGLPIGDWVITVNNKPVPKRKSVGNAVDITTKSLPKLGKLHCEIGIAEQASRADVIRLYGGGREICRIDDLPPEYLHELDPVFLHPRLYGIIDVERWLKKATVAKDSLRQDALAPEEWSVFVRACNAYLKKPIEEALEKSGAEDVSDDAVLKSIAVVGQVFEKTWGSAEELWGSQERSKGELEEPDRSATRGNVGSKTGTVQPTGTGNAKVRTKHPSSTGGKRKGLVGSMLIRIEDAVYEVYPTNTAESVPAEVVRGNIMVFARNFPRLQTVRKRGVMAMRSYVEEALVAAHVRHHKAGEGPRAFQTEVFDILNRLPVR